MRALLVAGLMALAVQAFAAGTPTGTPTSTATTKPTATLGATATNTPKPTATNGATATATLKPTEVQGAVMTRAPALKVPLATAAPTYIAAKGHYWQALKTSACPADGATVTPITNAAPYYEPGDTWDAVLPGVLNAAGEQAAYLQDVYDGPRGKGFVFCSCITTAGVEYWKCDNTGPETGRTFDWTAMPTEAP